MPALDESGATPSEIAASCDDPAMLDTCIECGLDVNSVPMGLCPLLISGAGKALEKTRRLVERGAAINF